MWTSANDFDRLAMQGEDTGVEEAEQHQATLLDDATKKERGEPIYYTMECSCGWRSERGRLGSVLDQSRAHRDAM
jgi:hypothetical protein